MRYRRFGKLKWKASILGFGAMRLPTTEDDHSRIDENEALAMVRFAIDHGVNYIDTAYPYHGGNSETFLGKTLQDGYRNKVKVATKMPTWLIKSEQDMNKYLNEQLDKLNTDHIDFYLLHGLNKERWQNLCRVNVLPWAEKKMEEGKFKYLGFSFHDEYRIFKKIVDAYDEWTLCQILYNYMDADYEAGTKGLKYAASRGLAVVVMEPIAGGRLAIKPHTEIEKLWNEADVKRTPAEWALLWVWNHPEATVTLSGMSSMTQVKENVKTAEQFRLGTLSPKELGIISRVARKYRQLGFIQCTQCRYCSPCPNGVDIPKIVSFYNKFYMKDRDEKVRGRYKQIISPERRAKRCQKCGKCEELCPKHLPIKKIVSSAAFIFEQ